MAEGERRTYGYIVLGCGGIGSAALYWLSKRAGKGNLACNTEQNVCLVFFFKNYGHVAFMFQYMYMYILLIHVYYLYDIYEYIFYNVINIHV